jgi:hypothetical protein
VRNPPDGAKEPTVSVGSLFSLFSGFQYKPTERLEQLTESGGLSVNEFSAEKYRVCGKRSEIKKKVTENERFFPLFKKRILMI